MELQLTSDLWLNHRHDQIVALNALTGKRVLFDLAQLEEFLKFCEPQCVGDDDPFAHRLLQADIITSPALHDTWLENRKLPLKKALEKFLAEHLGSTPSKIRKQFESSSHLLRRVLEVSLELSKRRDAEAVRDLRSTFRNAQTFLESHYSASSFSPEFLRAVWKRPDNSEEFGQLPCLPQTTESRIRFALDEVSQANKALILGDDDLLSLSWLHQTDLSCHTFELDPHLLELFGEYQQPNLEVYERDLTQGLPKKFHRAYDLVFTDPPYNKEGMDLFLRCCSQGLSENPWGRVFLNTRPDLIEDGDHLSQRLDSVGLQLEQTLVDFSKYLWPVELSRRAFQSLRDCGLSSHLLTTLLGLPFYHSDLLVLRRS